MDKKKKPIKFKVVKPKPKPTPQMEEKKKKIKFKVVKIADRKLDELKKKAEEQTKKDGIKRRVLPTGEVQRKKTKPAPEQKPKPVSELQRVAGLTKEQANKMNPAELFGKLPVELRKMVLDPKQTGVKIGAKYPIGTLIEENFYVYNYYTQTAYIKIIKMSKDDKYVTVASNEFGDILKDEGYKTKTGRIKETKYSEEQITNMISLEKNTNKKLASAKIVSPRTHFQSDATDDNFDHKKFGNRIGFDEADVYQDIGHVFQRVLENWLVSKPKFINFLKNNEDKRIQKKYDVGFKLYTKEGIVDIKGTFAVDNIWYNAHHDVVNLFNDNEGMQGFTIGGSGLKFENEDEDFKKMERLYDTTKGDKINKGYGPGLEIIYPTREYIKGKSLGKVMNEIKVMTYNTMISQKK